MTSIKELKAWTADHEISFLRGLGTYATTDEGSVRFTRKQCLDGYRGAFDRRANWCHIDHARVKEYLYEAT